LLKELKEKKSTIPGNGTQEKGGKGTKKKKPNTNQPIDSNKRQANSLRKEDHLFCYLTDRDKVPFSASTGREIDREKKNDLPRLVHRPAN